jgi:hypothetical protein
MNPTPTRTQSLRTSCIALLAVVLLFGVASACGSRGSTGSGNVQSETREVSGFDSVEFSGAGKLTIEQSGTESLSVRADDNLLPMLTSEVAGTTLKLGLKPGANLPDATDITYTVTVKQLKGVDLTGAGEVTLTRIEGTALTVANGGAGQVTASGRVTSQTVNLSGVGAFNGRDLVSEDADVTVSGTGSATVNASRSLKATVSGVGSVQYVGNPKVTQDVSGVGEVKKI